MFRQPRSILVALLATCLATTSTFAATPEFKLHRIGTYRSEACGVGDFNGDGKLDIIAGPFLYLAPDFRAVTVRELKGEVDEKKTTKLRNEIKASRSE